MGLRKITGEEVLKLSFVVTDDFDAYMDAGWESLEKILREQGLGDGDSLSGEPKKVAANKDSRTNAELIDSVMGDISPKRK